MPAILFDVFNLMYYDYFMNQRNSYHFQTIVSVLGKGGFNMVKNDMAYLQS